MSGIKVTAADKWFSLCVRERVGYVCERCGTFAPPERHKRLDCSHFHGRGKWSVRFDAENATALCMGCHLHVTANPIEHMAWMQERLGPYGFAALQERAQDIKRGRENRRAARDIAKHYKAELEVMRARRAHGESGRIEFVSW